MTDAWITTGVLAVATLTIKAVPLLALAGSRLPARMTGVIALLASALLAALVLTGTAAGEDRELVLDARAAGLLAAAGVLAARRSLIVAVIAAAAVTALLRAV